MHAWSTSAGAPCGPAAARCPTSFAIHLQLVDPSSGCCPQHLYAASRGSWRRTLLVMAAIISAERLAQSADQSSSLPWPVCTLLVTTA